MTSPGGIGVKQLLPVKMVGTGQHVTKIHDKLTRRQARRAVPVECMTQAIGNDLDKTGELDRSDS